MGGRGSSSAGGGGNAVSPGSMSDKELGAALAAAKADVENIGDRMEELARDMNRPSPNRSQEDWEAANRRYYAEQDKFRAARDRLFELQQESNEREAKRNPPIKKPFVNSYGEATDRYITSPSYERAQRRLERDVARNMGVTPMPTRRKKR